MSADGLALVGQLVAANVASAAATTDSLLAFQDEEIVRLARALVKLGEILESATVIDRRTERALSRFGGHFDHAANLLDRREATS